MDKGLSEYLVVCIFLRSSAYKTRDSFIPCLCKTRISAILYNRNSQENVPVNRSVKAAVLQIILQKNHELCKYAKISLHIHVHIVADLNQNIA